MRKFGIRNVCFVLGYEPMETLASFPKVGTNGFTGGRGRRARLYDKVLDGGAYRLRQGSDFTCSIATFVLRLRQAAAYRRVGLRTLQPEPRVVEVQAHPLSADISEGGSQHERPPDPRTRKGAIERLRREREDIERQRRESADEREDIAREAAAEHARVLALIAAGDQGKPPDGQPD